MFGNSITRCVIVFLLMSVTINGAHDIFDMFNEVKDQVADKVDIAANKVKEKVQKHVLNLKDGETCPKTYSTEYRTILTAYRQMIEDWLKKFPAKSAGKYRLSTELTRSDFQRLEQFASSSNFDQKTSLHEVHMISDLLKRMVSSIEDETVMMNSLTWSAWFRSFDINTIVKTIVALLFTGAISWIFIRTHIRRGRWFSTFFLMAFIVSFLQNWYNLYQEAQAKVDEVLMKKIPKHCQGHTMGVVDIIKAKFGRFFEIPVDECLQYHKAMRATPHSQVTPFQALSMTFAQLFVTPLGTIGESLSQFFAGTMRHVPVVLWPVMILIIVFIFIVIFLMYSRYEINLPFMMGSLRPSPHSAVSGSSTLLEKIEGSSNSTEQVQALTDRVKELESRLASRNLAVEDVPEPDSTPPPIGFREDLLN